MCTIMAAIGIASTLVGAAGQMQQAKSQAAASEYNAKVADMNATLSERRAKDALERGQKEEQRKLMEVSQLQGRQQAAAAANGVDTSWGSPLDTMVDTATMGHLDALTIRQNSAREAYDYRVQGVNAKSDATLKRMEAKSAITGGYLAAAGTVLTGAGNAYKSYATSKYGYA